MNEVWLYDIHGLFAIASERRLPELASFRRPRLRAEPDLRVRVVFRPTAHDPEAAIVYREWLGDAGFSLAIERRGASTDVVVSPLVGSSPHVLYTNVVEPLVRWGLVRKGLALMHGACVASEGVATFITARTDTGKTTTILRLLREHPASLAFLSDDMTILAPDGRVWSYPKPLTISFHTMRAIAGHSLTRAERFGLVVQSRLHSRGGRHAGFWLDRIGAPTATLNAVVQRLIPPPKYSVARLVPGVSTVGHAQLANVVLIERGEPVYEPLPSDELVPILQATSADAYGFPPYPAIASEVRSWHGEDLVDVEREIIASAMARVSGVRIRRNDFGWSVPLFDVIRGADAPAGGSRTGPSRTDPSTPVSAPSHVEWRATGG